MSKFLLTFITLLAATPVFADEPFSPLNPSGRLSTAKLVDAAGNTIGTAEAPIRNDPTGTTPQPTVIVGTAKGATLAAGTVTATDLGADRTALDVIVRDSLGGVIGTAETPSITKIVDELGDQTGTEINPLKVSIVQRELEPMLGDTCLFAQVPGTGETLTPVAGKKYRAIAIGDMVCVRKDAAITQCSEGIPFPKDAPEDVAFTPTGESDPVLHLFTPTTAGFWLCPVRAQ